MLSDKLNKVTDHNRHFISVESETCIKDTKTAFILRGALEVECKSMTKHFMQSTQNTNKVLDG